MQSVSITTDVVSSNFALCEVYSIQHYVIRFVSDLLQVNGFLRASSTNKANRHDIAEILLKVVFNTITPKMLSNPAFYDIHSTHKSHFLVETTGVIWTEGGNYILEMAKHNSLKFKFKFDFVSSKH